MSERVTDKDIEAKVNQMRSAGMAVAIDWTSNRPRVCTADMRINISPRLPRPTMDIWLDAYWVGWLSGREYAMQERHK